jgi:hypothetical protein
VRRVLALLVLTLVALAGCVASPSIDASAKGTVAGDAEVHARPFWPHPFAERSSRHDAGGCSSCEGGTCNAPGR